MIRHDGARRAQVPGAWFSFMALGLAAVLVLTACETGTRTLPSGALSTPGALESAKPMDLLTALQDEDAAVRIEAARVLGTRQDASAVGALVKLIDDPDPEVALAVVEALGQIGDPGAVESLLKIVAAPPVDADPSVAERYTAAIVALGKIRGPAAVVRLLELSTDTSLDSEATSAVDAALTGLGPSDVASLAKALTHKVQAVRLEAIDRLGAIGSPAVTVLLGQLASKTAAIRVAAADALGTAGDRRATNALVKGLADSKLTSAATRALVTIYKSDARPLLKYLKYKSTIKIYVAIIRIGQTGTESALITALDKFGGVSMAEDYLNCGNTKLDKAARAWATRHGYTVYTRPGTGGSVAWGG